MRVFLLIFQKRFPKNLDTGSSYATVIQQDLQMPLEVISILSEKNHQRLNHFNYGTCIVCFGWLCFKIVYLVNNSKTNFTICIF